MHEEIYDKLAEKYPFMRRDPSEIAKPFVANLYSAFGCEFGPGWYDILDRLCERIQQILKDDPEQAKTFEVIQVKEKFGGLRFYVSGYTDDLYNAIRQAEDESFKTCEECGKDGGSYKSEHGYYRTLCSGCAKLHNYKKCKDD